MDAQDRCLEGEKLMEINKNCVAIVAIVGIVVLSAICIKYEPPVSLIVFSVAGCSILGIAERKD